jgi:hypothetical protein
MIRVEATVFIFRSRKYLLWYAHRFEFDSELCRKVLVCMPLRFLNRLPEYVKVSSIPFVVDEIEGGGIEIRISAQ